MPVLYGFGSKDTETQLIKMRSETAKTLKSFCRVKLQKHLKIEQGRR